MGMSRDEVEEIIKDGDMPELYFEVVKALEKLN